MLTGASGSVVWAPGAGYRRSRQTRPRVSPALPSRDKVDDASRGMNKGLQARRSLAAPSPVERSTCSRKVAGSIPDVSLTGTPAKLLISCSESRLYRCLPTVPALLQP